MVQAWHASQPLARQDGLKLTNFDTHEGDNEKTAGLLVLRCHLAVAHSVLLFELDLGVQVKEMLDLTEP